LLITEVHWTLSPAINLVPTHARLIDTHPTQLAFLVQSREAQEQEEMAAMMKAAIARFEAGERGSEPNLPERVGHSLENQFHFKRAATGRCATREA
jgi:hypothetical protein